MSKPSVLRSLTRCSSITQLLHDSAWIRFCTSFNTTKMILFVPLGGNSVHCHVFVFCFFLFLTRAPDDDCYIITRTLRNLFLFLYYIMTWLVFVVWFLAFSENQFPFFLWSSGLFFILMFVENMCFNREKKCYLIHSISLLSQN